VTSALDDDQREANRATIRAAFDRWADGTAPIMRLQDGLVVEATAFFDSIAFDELWRRVQP
jgi:hypothetical protein